MKEIFTPTVLIFVGTILTAIGGFWATLQQRDFEKELRLISDESRAKSEEITKFTKKSLAILTGGESYCELKYEEKKPGLGELVVIPPEDYALYDIRAKIVDLDRVEAAKTDEDELQALIGEYVTIGNISPGDVKPIVVWKPIYDKQVRLRIYFTARNGGYVQDYKKIKTADGWLSASKMDALGKYDEEKIDDKFPRNEHGEVEW